MTSPCVHLANDDDRLAVGTTLKSFCTLSVKGSVMVQIKFKKGKENMVIIEENHRVQNQLYSLKAFLNCIILKITINVGYKQNLK